MSIFDMLQLAGGLTLSAFYMPSIYALYKAKTTKEISLVGWIMLLTGLSFMEINAYHLTTLGTWSYFITETINVALCLVYVLEIVYYRYIYNKKNK